MGLLKIKYILFALILSVLISNTYGLYTFRGPLRNTKANDWTALRLAYINDVNDVNSVALLSAWIAGIASEIDIADDGDGTITIGIVDPLAVNKGGTGQSSYTNGQLLIGNTTGNTLTKAILTGTVNRINVVNGAGNITISTPQDINTISSPAFVNLVLTGYQQFSEISTPATPDPNIIRLYSKDDGTGTSRIYILDDMGIETDLTGGGGGATTLDALTDVDLGLSPYAIGKILIADGNQYIDAYLSHTDLNDIGTNTHAQIDTHLASTANPHSVTAAQVSAVALAGNETIAGIKTFSSFPILPSSVPTTDYQAVHKSYVDTYIQGLEVKLACRAATVIAGTLATSFENGDTIDGVELATDNRILIQDQVAGATNGIYTVNASGAPTRATDYDTSTEAQEGTYTFITEGAVNGGYQFVQITKAPILGTDDLIFTYLNKLSAYTASLGVELVGADLRADLLATGALGLTGNELKVNVDNSSIEISSNALRVKAIGITNAMLAGSITDSKLNTISTVNKVDWAAVNKTGSILDDIANVNVPAPTNGQALAYNTATSMWIPATIEGGGGAVNAAVMDVDVYSSGTVDAKWTNMPAAVTELFGNTSSRIKTDLTYATYYRIEVVQTTAGYSTADFNLQYSTDNVTYQTADTGGAGECAVGAGTGVKVGSWAALIAGAQADVWLRIVGKQGNGAVDPQWRQIRIQFKMLSTGGASPANAQYVTLAADGTLSAERVLTGTTNQITVTDGGAGNTVTLSTPQNLHTGATPTFAKIFIDDANSYSDTDGSKNMTFTDVITGTKTLAELASGGVDALLLEGITIEELLLE